MSTQTWGRNSRLGAAHRRGQILVITLLAITLLVGLIFYVYNVGDQVNRRLELQNAADASTIAGATWMGRSMNLLAMNNVTQARLIALALVIDSLPLAAEMTVAEETGPDALPIALENQLKRGVPSTDLERYNFLKRGLEEIHRQMKRSPSVDEPTDLDVISAIDRALDQDDERELEGGPAFDVARATEWGDDEEYPTGAIWEAIKAIDDLSIAVQESAVMLAQESTLRIGQANNARRAVLVPVLPRIPAYRGTFDDFEPVLVDHVQFINDPARGIIVGPRRRNTDLVGMLEGRDILKEIEHVSARGGAIPDFRKPHRLGPFAQVYMWRDYARRSEGDWWEEGYTTLRIGFNSYGPLEHALRIVLDQFGRGFGIARTTRFPHHVRKIATLKLAYLFGLGYPQKVQYAKKWVHDYDKAKEFASDKDNHDQILRTRWYRVVVDSTERYPEPDKPSVRWLTGRRGESREDRTFYSRYPSQIQPDLAGPIASQPLGRWDTDLTFRGRWWNPPGTKVKDHVWVRKWTNNRVRESWAFNLAPRANLDSKGNILSYDYYTLYHVEWWVWGGMEIRDEVTISNPLAGVHFDALPAPYLLDTSQGDYDFEWPDPDASVRRKLFTFLGVAHRSDRARIWEQQFASQNPAQAAVAVAQAKLFNNKSWDLWTQNWEVQLCPVSRWDDWVDQIVEADDDEHALETEGRVRTQDVHFLRQYMENIDEDMAERYMSH